MLALPFLDHVVRLRYPADADPTRGPVKLKQLTLESGWLADNASWTSGLTRIAAYGDYQGDKSAASWLPDQDLAFIYRAFATYNRPLKIVIPNLGATNTLAINAGADLPIVVDDSGFAEWKKLEFFDGAAKLGELAEGPAKWTCKARDLTPGYHVISALATDAKGTMRTSQPVLVVVRAIGA